ncbi:MAG: hypothetical protein AAGP08_10780 [Pseudomonadota bacterium]
MSLFVLSRDTVMNPGALKTGSVPRKHIKRIAILPKTEAPRWLRLRVLAESEPLRFAIALTPFIAAMFVWRDLALPISQAPLAMLIVIGFFELRVLRLPAHRREKVTTEARAARALDTLAFRSRAILSEIAADQGDSEGELLLVVEQSELAFFPTLTIVSVQTAHGGTRLLDLTPRLRDVIRTKLFDDDFTEKDLHKANLRENVFLRSIAFDARAVSGHARLAAILAKPAAEASPA